MGMVRTIIPDLVKFVKYLLFNKYVPKYVLIFFQIPAVFVSKAFGARPRLFL